MSQKLFSSLALLSIGLAFGAQAQKGQKVTIPRRIPRQADKQLTIDFSSSSDWRQTSASPRMLLAKCDAFLAGLKGVSAQTRFMFQVGQEGRFGVSTGDLAIADSRKFRANFAHISYVKGEYGLHGGDLIADGASFQKRDESGWTMPTPISAPRLPKQFLSGWAANFQQLIFAGLGTNQRPLTALFSAATAAGLRVQAEYRTLSAEFKEYRVVISGNTSLDGRPTRFETEVLIDAATFAPLKITQLRRYQHDMANQFRAYWTIKWDRSPNQVFDPTIFVVASKEMVRASHTKG